MAHYIHFTEEQKELARQTDLCDLLRRQGEKLKRSGSEYEWRDGSQKVTIRGNLWFHQYERTGGDAVDFVQRYYHKSFPEAVEYLLDALLRAFPLDDAGSVRYCALIDAFLPLFDDYLLSAGLLSL